MLEAKSQLLIQPVLQPVMPPQIEILIGQLGVSLSTTPNFSNRSLPVYGMRSNQHGYAHCEFLYLKLVSSCIGC